MGLYDANPSHLGVVLCLLDIGCLGLNVLLVSHRQLTVLDATTISQQLQDRLAAHGAANLRDLFARQAQFVDKGGRFGDMIESLLVVLAHLHHSVKVCHGEGVAASRNQERIIVDIHLAKCLPLNEIDKHVHGLRILALDTVLDIGADLTAQGRTLMTAGQGLVTAHVARKTVAGSSAGHITLALMRTLPDTAFAAGSAWDIAGLVALGMCTHHRANLCAGRTGFFAMTPELAAMATELGTTAFDFTFSMARPFDFMSCEWCSDLLSLGRRQLLALVAGTDTPMATLEVLFALHIALCQLRVLPALHNLFVLTVRKLAENLDGAGDLGGIPFLPAPGFFQDVTTWQSHW